MTIYSLDVLFLFGTSLLFYTLGLMNSDCAQSLCHVRLFGTPDSVALQTPACLWDFSGKNTGVGCHFLLQGIFPTQGLNPCILHWQEDSLPLSHPGSPFSEWQALSNVFFELIRDILKGRTLHQRITTIGFQTAVPSIPMVDKVRGNCSWGVNYY